MFQKVKNVAMKDFNNGDILVTGVMSEDKNFVVACGVRKISKEKIKEITTTNGHICTVAMGDVQIFGVKSVGEVDENGYATADLFPIQKKPTTVSYMKYKASGEKEYGDPFPGSILEGEVVKGKNQLKVDTIADFFSEDLVNAYTEALAVCPFEKIQRSRSSRYAALAKEFADLVPTATPAQAEQQYESAVPATGKTINEVLPQ